MTDSIEQQRLPIFGVSGNPVLGGDGTNRDNAKIGKAGKT